MSNLKHAKLTTYTPRPDGATDITDESYHESLTSIRQRIRLNITSTRATLLTDIIKCLDVISSHESQELVIEVKDTPRGVMITKTWTTSKEKY